MSDSFNPYAPPSASLEPAGAGPWRDGKALVLRPGMTLPPRCVKCNAPVDAPAKKKKVYWHHPAIYLLVLVAVLLYLIVALVVRKQAEVNPALCVAHRKRRWTGIAVGWVGALAGFAVAILGVGMDSCGVMTVGGFLFLGAIVAGMTLARVVYPERISKEFVRLRGCGEDFLASFPAFPG